MLLYLKVKNYAVVEEATIELSPGLNVFTGETGAGKSLIIGAISLLFNKKISAHALRDKEKPLEVEALFERDDKEFLIKREYRGRRSYCYLNNEAVPFSKIEEISSSFLLFTEHATNVNRKITAIVFISI